MSKFERMTQLRQISATRRMTNVAVAIGAFLSLGVLGVMLPGPTATALAQVAEQAEPVLAPTSCPPSDVPSDLSMLVTQLMLDLPSYSNRVIQRASKIEKPTLLYLMAAGQVEISPVLLTTPAKKANRSRLPSVDLGRHGAPAEEIYQILFTTLDRRYGTLNSSSVGAIPSRAPLPSALVSPGESSIEESIATPRGEPIVGPTAGATVRPILHRSSAAQQFHWLVLARQQAQRHGEATPWRIVSLRSQLAPYPANNELLAPARDSRQSPVGQGITVWLRDWRNGAIRWTNSPLAQSAGAEAIDDRTSDSGCPPQS